MNDNTLTPDRYAGDEAWQDWFDICSVGGCPAEHAAALRRQVESAMYSTLLKRGVSREEAGADDPVAVFDAYFKLKGSRETKKPLKSYFAYRIKVEGMRLADFVCGTLFGSGAGRVHDIVLDWIASIKGWRPRKVKGPDGRRRIEWESAGPAEIAALDGLHNRRIAINLMTRRDHRRIGGCNRGRARSAEVSNNTRANRCKRNKSRYRAFANTFDLSIGFTAIRRHNLNGFYAALPKFSEHLIT